MRGRSGTSITTLETFVIIHVGQPPVWLEDEWITAVTTQAMNQPGREPASRKLIITTKQCILP